MALETKKVVRKTPCGSCGAEVPIYSRGSIQVVCPFCRSTLVRSDMDWETIGKMATLADDLSPLHIGLRGKYKRTGFTIIGRIQQKYTEGIWNEWLLNLDNKKTAWLGEGSGLFYFTSPSTSREALPAFADLSLGKNVILDGKHYTVSNIESAQCIASEGETPFAATPGDSANLVDLIGENSNFASLDYSDGQVKLYTGKSLNLDELQFNSIDNNDLKQLPGQELRCAGCGNAVTITNPASITVSCATCSMVNNKSTAGKLVAAYSQASLKLRPAINLGNHGILEGHDYEVIGFMSRSADGDKWDEYLLYNPAQGIRWLVCAQGHWSFIRPAKAQPRLQNPQFFKGRTYKHFSTYNADVTGVLGEFYWQVKRGERSRCTDYICPPFILTAEKSDKEIVWSEGYYIPAQDIAAAFNIKAISATYGVGINQPSPMILGYLGAFIITMMLAAIITAFVNSGRMESVNIGQLELTHWQGTSKLVSEPFILKSDRGLFQIKTTTNLNNDWAGLEYSLVNQDTGETRLMYREMAYYSGHDSDGNWSEGSNRDNAILPNVPAGKYVLEVDAETDRAYSYGYGSGKTVIANISSTHAEGSSKNLWAMFWILGIAPLLAGLNKYYFEKRRWDQSDHPWESEE